VFIKEMQQHLMGNGRNDINHTWIEGTSTLNQRIESFWGVLRKECMQFWLELFHELKTNGNFTGDFIDVNLSQFCFMSLVQVKVFCFIMNLFIHYLDDIKMSLTLTTYASFC
jgi:transposase InsO family protein